ncbi:MAG: hypothetical protein QXF82_08020 [Nitrososphaeria archaeon]
MESKELKFSTKKNREMVNVGDKLLFYVKNKGVLATGFQIREIDNKKPYLAKVNFLPLYSKYKPIDQGFDSTRGKLILINEDRYTELKNSMEKLKIPDYDSLKGWAQRKGENFEKVVRKFFNDILAPLQDAEIKEDAIYEIDKKRQFKNELLIKFKNYDILCDAFVNRAEIGSKIHKFNDIYGALDPSKKEFIRFVLFYKGNEDELSFRKENLNEKTIILDNNAMQYYEWLSNETKLPKEPPNDTPIAAYHMLGELKIGLQNKSVIASPYLKSSDGKNVLYMFKKDIGEIAPILYVARRERGKKKFYQRMLKRKKLCGNGSIDDYLSSNDEETPNEREHTTFLNSIIISPEEIKEGENQIEIPFRYGSVAILDGQHRAYGAYLNELKMKKKNELYFTAIVDETKRAIPIEVQQEYFITVNTAQTKVDPEEIWRAYSDLSAYKNKLNGIISQAVKKIEKERILIIKKQIENEPESKKGISFSGLCVNIEKFIRSTGLFKKSNKDGYTNEEANKYANDIFNIVNILISAIRNTFEEENRKKFLEHDGRLSVLFKLFAKIYLVNGTNINEKIVAPYFTVLNKILVNDKSLIDKIETAGEGPREKSADMLGGLINNELPPGVKSLGVDKYGGKDIIEEIGNLLNKLSKTRLKDKNGQYEKDEKGQYKAPISSTGGWWNFSLSLNKPITSLNDFEINVITVLYKLFEEDRKNIPTDVDTNVIKKIDSLRTWFQHETEHGEPNKINQKREHAEMVVNEYLHIRGKTPDDLNLRQLEELKKGILNDVLKLLRDIYSKVSEEIYTIT